MSYILLFTVITVLGFSLALPLKANAHTVRICVNSLLCRATWHSSGVERRAPAVRKISIAILYKIRIEIASKKGHSYREHCSGNSRSTCEGRA